MFRTIYVYYPRGVRTGGPEALHQLVDMLRRLGHDAWLTPIPGTEDRTRVPQYAIYDAPETDTARDDPQDCIVFPEVWLEPMRLPGPAQRLCWWLSVDNSAFLQAEMLWRNRRLRAPDGRPSQLLRARLAEWPLKLRARRWTQRVGHLAQSRYAQDFLAQRLHLTAPALSDYVTAPPKGNLGRPVMSGDSTPTVAYNAVKGGAHVERLKSALSLPVTWVAIGDMSPEQVQSTLRRCDVYVDLGHQPGKDRMPREAALAGALTVLTRVGAGANSEDFPIPNDHKVGVQGDIVANAVAVLTRVLRDLPREFARQHAYRESLLGEERTFAAEVEAVFGART